MNEHNGYLVVLVTAASETQARDLAKILLAQNLAACVNLVPVQSLYLWEGEMRDDREVLMIIKSTSAVFQDKVIAAIKAHHSYQVPEIIGLPIVMGAADYLAWISGLVK